MVNTKESTKSCAKSCAKSWINSYFSNDDLQRLEKAVVQAESATSAEVVPVIAKQSSTTGHVFPLAFFILASVVFSIPKDFLFYKEGWYQLGWFYDYLYVFEFVLVLGVSWTLSQTAWLRRLLTSSLDLGLQVDWRAEIEFSERILNKTENHTGVLLYVSLMERRAVLLADASVKNLCPEETWSQTLQSLLVNLRQKGLTEALEETLLDIGKILSEKLPLEKNDQNEISDRLIWLDS